VERRGPGPRALYRDILQVIFDELADPGATVDVRNNLEEEIRRRKQGPLPGITQAVRIHLVPEGPRPLSDHHVDRALGRYPHGRFTRTSHGASAQDLRSHVRPRDGLLGMQRAALCERSARTSRPWRPEILAGSCTGHWHQGSKDRLARGRA
jgi:hypothetical protein